jgi:hypothetical protein
MSQKALSTIRGILKQIITESDDPTVDNLAAQALAVATQEDARTSSPKPSARK